MREFEDYPFWVAFPLLMMLGTVAMAAVVTPLAYWVNSYDNRVNAENSRAWVEACTNLCVQAQYESTRDRCAFKCTIDERANQLRKR